MACSRDVVDSGPTADVGQGYVVDLVRGDAHSPKPRATAGAPGGIELPLSDGSCATSSSGATPPSSAVACSTQLGRR